MKSLTERLIEAPEEVRKRYFDIAFERVKNPGEFEYYCDVFNAVAMHVMREEKGEECDTE